DVGDAVVKAVNTAVDWLKEELDVYEGAVDDLLNLVVNAAGYAADHPNDCTLADAIEANYDGTGCLRDCDDGDDCADPEHSNVVQEVLSWIAALGGPRRSHRLPGAQRHAERPRWCCRKAGVNGGTTADTPSCTALRAG